MVKVKVRRRLGTHEKMTVCLFASLLKDVKLGGRKVSKVYVFMTTIWKVVDKMK